MAIKSVDAGAVTKTTLSGDDAESAVVVVVSASSVESSDVTIPFPRSTV